MLASVARKSEHSATRTCHYVNGEHPEEPRHVTRIEDSVRQGLNKLDEKPDDSVPDSKKKLYSEKMSEALSVSFADELRHRGMTSTRPAGPGEVGRSGARRRIAGGFFAKRIDVTWTTEESGLLLGISLKTINFRDRRTKKFQKNLTNRRGDLAVEAATLHRRFPYAVLAGFVVMDKGAREDGTNRRNSTFENAFPKFRIFTGRSDPAAREEQFERLYIMLVDANRFQSDFECYAANDPARVVPLDEAFDDLVTLVVERNFDLYEPDGADGLRKVP
jgi:hypothetical protein